LFREKAKEWWGVVVPAHAFDVNLLGDATHRAR
jgi:hypothetical protein